MISYHKGSNQRAGERQHGAFVQVRVQHIEAARARGVKRGRVRAIGLVELDDPDGRGSLTGAQWQSLQAALDDPAPFHATLLQAASLGELKPQLRALLHYHCGVATLRTRQLMMDLQGL